jgi:hypothetical protein
MKHETKMAPAKSSSTWMFSRKRKRDFLGSDTDKTRRIEFVGLRAVALSHDTI